MKTMWSVIAQGHLGGEIPCGKRPNRMAHMQFVQGVVFGICGAENGHFLAQNRRKRVKLFLQKAGCCVGNTL